MKTLKKLQKSKKPVIEYVAKPSSELDSVRILRGRYKGVIYTYGVVKMNGQEPDYILKFTFRVECGTILHSKEKLEACPKFKNFIGDILMAIIADDDNLIKDAGKPTGTDTQESDSKRIILS